MATLTDEEKAALIEGTDAKDAAEAKRLQEEQSTDDQQTETDETEKQAQATDESHDATESFTKQFPNLKGDAWDDYGPNLEQAYQNSFTEALRLKKELDEARKVIANLPAIQDAGTQQEQQQTAPLTGIEQLPEIQYVKAIQQRDMRSAFDKFAERYPQVREEENFRKFRDAATPMGQAFTAANGRDPTYEELFPMIAGAFQWEAADAEARRGQNLKENLSQGTAGNNGQSRRPARGPSVTEAQVDAYLRMFPAKNRNDVIKELQEALT